MRLTKNVFQSPLPNSLINVHYLRADNIALSASVSHLQDQAHHLRAHEQFFHLLQVPRNQSDLSKADGSSLAGIWRAWFLRHRNEQTCNK